MTTGQELRGRDFDKLSFADCDPNGDFVLFFFFLALLLRYEIKIFVCDGTLSAQENCY